MLFKVSPTFETVFNVSLSFSTFSATFPGLSIYLIMFSLLSITLGSLIEMSRPKKIISNGKKLTLEELSTHSLI